MTTTVKISAPSLADPDTLDEDEAQITDNFVIVCDGTAYVASRQIYRCADGTTTTTLTIKGARP